MSATTSAPFIYDSEKLGRLASAEAYRLGLADYRQERVLEVYVSGASLIALVDDTGSELPYRLELTHNSQHEPESWCDCEQGLLCRHAVAALLKYASQQGEQATPSASPMDLAIAERVKRGQTEVAVEHLHGHPWFGAWQARTIAADSPWARSYQVQIRSLHDRINDCTCPDRANNQLGTCKHIEAVLHRVRKKLGEQVSDCQPPLPFVYLDDRNGWQIRLQRTADTTPELARLLDGYFDARGVFTGAGPEDFFRFCDRVYANDDILIGRDAREAMQREAARQAQQWQAEKIRRQIMQSGGTLQGVNAKLYSYQVEGVAFLAANGRALLADDMGLGKTLQAIAASNWLIEHAGVKRVLILCPASLKQQWSREIEKFTGHQVQIVQGNAAQRQVQYRQDKTFFVLNYEMAIRDLSVLNACLTPDLLILDEAQRIKNWRTQTAMAVKQLNSRYAFVLTGTPLENRLEDLYSLMQVVDQHLLGPLWRYLNDFHVLDDKGKVQGYRNLSELRRRIAPVMLRRNRSIVSDQLPDRINSRLDVAMTTRQRELHNGALSTAAYYGNIAKRRPLTPTERNRLMAALQQARMACNAAGLVDKETEGSPKLRELKTLVQELCVEGGRKMVVFSQWREMTLMIEAMLLSMGVGCVHLHGQVPTHKRGELMDRFASDDAVQVFLSTDAGGSGLNLQQASVLVNMDVPWNPAVLEQRNARVHRLGQRRQVQIILMVAENSYEERVLQMVGSKQHLFDNVVENEDGDDVVGISTRSLAELCDTLAQLTGDNTTQLDDPQPAAPAPNAAELAEAEPLDPEQADHEQPDPEQQNPAASANTLVAGTDDEQRDSSLRQGIAAAQRYYGDRLLSVRAQARGLLLVLEQVSADDEQWLAQQALPVPVALIDLRTQRQLQNLGIELQETSSPVRPAMPQQPDWHRQASEQLDGAKLLLEQGHHGAVMALLGTAVSTWLAHIRNLDAPMPLDGLALWLYGEAVPQQQLEPHQVSVLAQWLGLRHTDSLPIPLLTGLHQQLCQLLKAQVSD